MKVVLRFFKNFLFTVTVIALVLLILLQLPPLQKQIITNIINQAEGIVVKKIRLKQSLFFPFKVNLPLVHLQYKNNTFIVNNLSINLNFKKLAFRLNILANKKLNMRLVGDANLSGFKTSLKLHQRHKDAFVPLGNLVAQGKFTEKVFLNWTTAEENNHPIKTANLEIEDIQSYSPKISFICLEYNQRVVLAKLTLNLKDRNIDGFMDIDIADIEPYVSTYVHGLAGKLKGKLVLNKQSLENGHSDLTLTTKLLLNGDNIPLTFHGKSQGTKIDVLLQIKDGKLFDEPFNLLLKSFITPKNISISEFTGNIHRVNFQLKDSLYNFDKGITPTKLYVDKGYFDIKELYIGKNYESSCVDVQTYAVKAENIAKLIFPEKNIKLGGIINIAIEKLKGKKQAEANINVRNGFWHYLGVKGLRPIIHDFSCDAKAINHGNTVSWDVDIKDAKHILVNSKGSYNLDSEKIDTKVKFYMNLRFLSQWIGIQDRILGKVNLESTISGHYFSPMFAGKGTLRDGYYELNGEGMIIKNIHLDCHFDKKTLHITKISGQDPSAAASTTKDKKKGHITGSGSVDLSDLLKPIVDLKLKFDQFKLSNSEILITDGTGWVRLHDVHKDGRIGASGDVGLSNGTFFIIPSAKSKVAFIDVINLPNEITTKDLATSSEETVFPLNIHVKIPKKQLEILGMGAKMQWYGKLHITDSVLTPKIKGKLELYKGTFTILGNKLDLQPSKITFANAHPIDPYLDITAQRLFKGHIKASIVIKGRSSKPDIQFTSEPLKTKEEIISLILFGKELGNVSMFQALRIASLARSQTMKPGLMEGLQSTLGLDSFEFDTGITGNKDDSGSKKNSIKIGKDFGKVSVAVEQGTSNDSSHIIVTAPLTENIALEGDVGRNSGAGISWVKRY